MFFDQGSIAAGADFSENIERAFSDAKAIVVLLSRNSNRSRWVDAEVRSALQSGKVVIPVLLDEEATNNWVWPLVSDRKAIRLGSPGELGEVVREINRAIGHLDMPLVMRSAPMESSASRSRSLILLVAVFSALAGALAVWFTK